MIVKVQKQLLGHLLCLLIISSYVLEARADDLVEEMLLRAAFIERITRFIAWPSSKTVAERFDLCIYKNEDVKDAFTALYRETRIKDRRVKARLVSQMQELASCEVLYIASLLADDERQALRTSAHTHAILLITEYEGSGLHVNLYPIRGKLKIEMDPHELNSIGFKINSQLLNYVKIAKRSD